MILVTQRLEHVAKSFLSFLNGLSCPVFVILLLEKDQRFFFVFFNCLLFVFIKMEVNLNKVNESKCCLNVFGINSMGQNML